MKYWTVVLRHTMYGDEKISGEFLDELHAKIYRNGAAMVLEMRGGNGYHENIVVVEHEDKS